MNDVLSNFQPSTRSKSEFTHLLYHNNGFDLWVIVTVLFERLVFGFRNSQIFHNVTTESTCSVEGVQGGADVGKTLTFIKRYQNIVCAGRTWDGNGRIITNTNTTATIDVNGAWEGLFFRAYHQMQWTCRI